MRDVKDILGAGGAISNLKPDYESRPQQIEMAEAVARAIESRTHLIVEAGTGVGKSYAYLVAAIEWAARTNKKVVISTGTIALQEQIFRKDIPFLKSVMPPFVAALVKGRENYLSLRRLKNARDDANTLFPDKEFVDDLGEIIKWASTSTVGSKSELDFQPLPRVWAEVASDRYDCLGRKCPTRDSCFYFAARERMEHANVLVVNHALFMTNLVLRRRGRDFLPKYDAVIFDEAHELEDIASNYFGSKVNTRQIQYNLKRLWNDQKESGLANDAGRWLPTDWSKGVRDRVEATWITANEFFGLIQEDMDKLEKKRYRSAKDWPDTLAESLAKLAAIVNFGAQDLDPRDEEVRRKEYGRSRPEKSKKRDVGAKLHGLADHFQEMAAVAGDWLRQTDPDSVYWALLSREIPSISPLI
jgi:ATP-dependent DNA helicase DinG